MYTAHCDCMAGLGEACSHVAALLFKIEVGVKLGLMGESSTSRACEWNKTFREKIDPDPMVELFQLTKRIGKTSYHLAGTLLKLLCQAPPHS